MSPICKASATLSTSLRCQRVHPKAGDARMLQLLAREAQAALRCGKRAWRHYRRFGHHRDDNAQTLLMNLLQKPEVLPATCRKIHMKHYGITIVRRSSTFPKTTSKSLPSRKDSCASWCRCPVGQNSCANVPKDLLQEMETPFRRHATTLPSPRFCTDRKSA